MRGHRRRGAGGAATVQGPPPARVRLPVSPPAAPAAEPRSAGRATAILVAGVLVLGAALRTAGVVRFPFEQDELYTVFEATDLFRTELKPGIESRPLYFLLQHALFWVLPRSEWGLRGVPLLFGVLGIWLTWHAGTRLFGRTAGLVAALLVAIAPWHLHASGMARYWSLLYLLATAFYLCLARAYETDRRRHYGGALAALVLGTLTHPTFVFPAAGAALAVTLLRADGRPGWRWPSRRGWTRLWGPYALALAAEFAVLRLTGSGGSVQNWGGRGWLASLRLLPAIVEWATPVLCVAGAVGAVCLLRAGTPEQRRWGAMCIGGCGVALALLAAASLRTNVYADYAITMLPLLFVSAGALAQLAADRIGGAAPGLAAAAVLGAGVLPSTASHLSSGTRFDYRPAYAQILATEPGVPVVTWPLVVQRHYAPALRAVPFTRDTVRLNAALAAPGGVWFVASVQRYGIVADDEGQVARWLGAHCAPRGAHERPRWDYRRYRVELHRCHAARPR